MFESNDRSTAGATRRLYEEFARYYTTERCPWAPENPRRVFNLAFEVIYPRWCDVLTEEEFLRAIYDILGFRGSKPQGLFETFDANQYGGPLPLPDHFVNLFRVKLEGRVLDECRRATRLRRRKYKPGTLTPNGERRLKRLDNPLTGADQERVDALAEALAVLPPVELAVVHMTYWGRYSRQEVADQLDLDRDTVRRRHESALARLRVFYGVSAKSAA